MNLCAFFDNQSLGNFNHFSAIVGLKPDIEFSKMNDVSYITSTISELEYLPNLLERWLLCQIFFFELETSNFGYLLIYFYFF